MTAMSGSLCAFLSDVEGGTKGTITFSFPTDVLAEEYLAVAQSRPIDEIKMLLRSFLMESCALGLDEFHLDIELQHRRQELLDALKQGRLSEFQQRRLRWSLTGHKSAPPWQGNTWVLDLLPLHPNKAIEALESYCIAHCQHLPDGRIHGIQDAQDLIRTAFIEPHDDESQVFEKLHTLTTRDFEVLCAGLYHEMGYEVTVTPRIKDGGKDIMAKRRMAGQRETLYIECKLKRRRASVELVRAFGYSVLQRGDLVTRGVFIAPGGFTEGEQTAATETADADARIELVGLRSFVRLMNGNFGRDWAEHLPEIVRETSRFRLVP